MSTPVYALGRAAQELFDEVQRYKITVIPSDGTISWGNEVVQIKPYTPKMICKREIRRLIRKAKDAEHAAMMEKQGRLL